MREPGTGGVGKKTEHQVRPYYCQPSLTRTFSIRRDIASGNIHHHISMDKKHKDIVEEYRNLLCKNLILSEDFYRVLVTHGVFTEGLIKDIKVCSI